MSSNISIERVCDYCGKKFLAKTTRTRYCSHICNSRDYKRRAKLDKISVSNEGNKQKELIGSGIVDLQYKDILTVSDVAVYLSVSKRTVYSWLNEGRIKGRRVSNRKVLFLKADLISTLNSLGDYEKPIAQKTISQEFYTYKEIIEKYNVSLSWLYIVVERNRIRKIKRSGIVYLSKVDINNYYEKHEKDIKNIEDWYSIEEIIDKYQLSRDAIYGKCKTYRVPKKKEGRYVKISKKHFDDIFKNVL